MDFSKFEEDIIDLDVWHLRRPMEDHNRDFEDTQFKVNIPYFDGHIHIKEYMDWELAVKNFFGYIKVIADK